MEGLVYFTINEANCRVPKKTTTTTTTTTTAEGEKRERDVLSLERSEMKGWQIDAYLSM